MPQVGAFLAAVWQGAHGAVAAFALKTAASVALNLAAAKIMSPSGPRPQDLTSELRSSNAQRVRHLGRVRASGAVMFWDWAHVDGKRRLFKLLAVAEGGMADVHQWYLDGEPVDVDANGYVTTAPWNLGNIRLRFRRGIEGDQWDGGDWAALRAAFPGQWTTDHRLRGVGCILATFDAVGGEDIADVYSGGDPEVSVLISGSPQYRPDTDDYVQTRNPATMLGDILSHPVYGPMAAADIDMALLASARNRCSADVVTAGGTRQRYQAGASFALSDATKDSAQRLLDAMGGMAWITPEGRIGVRAGAWIAPTVTITEHHVVQMDYGAGTDRISRVTTLVPTYVSPETGWQETTADPVEDVAAIARWGEGQPKSMDLLAVQHHGQAAHLCRQSLARMNPARSMTIKMRSSGLLLMGEQAVFVNIPRIGLSNVPFWVERFGWDGSNVTVDLIEADPASLGDIAVADEGNPPAAPVAIDRDGGVFATEIASVTVVTNDGSPYIRVAGTQTGEAGFRPMAQFRRTGAALWTDMIEETVASGYSFRTPPLADLVEYDVRTFIGSRTRTGSDGSDLRIVSTPTVVSGIDVIANETPPDEPVVTAESGAAGGTLSVTFVPDLGANYRRTGLYRGGVSGTFDAATFVRWSYSTSTDVTLTAPVPGGGARFWLQSENPSQRKSDPVLVGTYT